MREIDVYHVWYTNADGVEIHDFTFYPAMAVLACRLWESIDLPFQMEILELEEAIRRYPLFFLVSWQDQLDQDCDEIYRSLESAVERAEILFEEGRKPRLVPLHHLGVRLETVRDLH